MHEDRQKLEQTWTFNSHAAIKLCILMKNCSSIYHYFLQEIKASLIVVLQKQSSVLYYIISNQK